MEIFSSAQGEGPWVGESTIFVRFGGCDLRCAWCDSPHTWKRSASCRIEEEAGSCRFRSLPNPLAGDDVIAALEALRPAEHRFVALTGGEPLLQHEAVGELARAARGLGMRSYLETHGLAEPELSEVLADIDVVSMDWKLASDVFREGAHGDEREDFGPLHEKFLATAVAGAETYVKVVITSNTLDEEIDAVCRGIRAVAPQVPLVLQPVTPRASIEERPSAEAILRWQRRCLAQLEHVRVIPQTHPLYAAP